MHRSDNKTSSSMCYLFVDGIITMIANIDSIDMIKMQETEDKEWIFVHS